MITEEFVLFQLGQSWTDLYGAQFVVPPMFTQREYCSLYFITLTQCHVPCILLSHKPRGGNNPTKPTSQ